MPVTAKLSKAFYERLGENITNELVDWFNQVDATYRSDLRELNELNFARFDAKLEQRMSQLDGKWEHRMSQLDAKWDVRFARLEAHVEQRINTMGERITAVGVEVRRDIDALRIELRDRESRMLRWMSASWVTALGIVITLLRLWG